MKLKLILSFILLIFFSFNAIAQTNVKVGFADVEYIVGNMPESVKAQADLDIVLNKLQKTRDSLVANYNVKLEDYKKNEKTFEDVNKKKFQSDLVRIQQGIQGFEMDMQTAVDYKKSELLKPIYKRIGELINEVAKENGFTLVVNSEINGNSVVLYAEESTDISDLVIAKAKK